MGVYIKGMEMPTNCLSCPLQGGTADCRLTQKTYNWGLPERPSDCPLVPAADVRPVKRGKWIQKKNWTRGVCSACSWEIAFVTGNSYNFCPNCGADMREGS